MNYGKRSPTTKNPNFYEVQGDGIYITYATTGVAGDPQFSYQDTNLSKSFSGKDIRVDGTEVGSLVTVTIALTVDQGSTTFSLLVPRINLRLFETAQISTIGITTIHRFSIIGPPHGQDDYYAAHVLSGSASFVEF
jgi:hypothetical protein